jgi:citronellol/citronellal dehydrogenase
MNELTDQVAIITGGGTGIGEATARLFAEHGAAGIVIAARTEAEIERVAADISATTSTRCVAVRTDVKDEASIINLVETTVREFGRIDILINNAGGARMGPLESMATRWWDSTFELNVRGPFILTREAGKHMIAAKRGVIVNISSDAGVHGVRYGAAYSASKTALQMLTKVTAGEWGRHGIRANCIAVGLVASPRAVSAWEVANVDPEEVTQHIPVGRIGYPIDIANGILYLSTDASSFVSGQTYSIDGGPNLGGPPAQD